MSTLLINASPARRSRSAALLDAARLKLQQQGEPTRSLRLADLPAQPLLAGAHEDAAIRHAVAQVEAADAIVIATPVYKAAYSGLLKVFLDLLPQAALKDRTVLPLATGGSSHHMLALDYALRPVLQSLVARNILPGVYAVEAQIALTPEGAYALAQDLDRRLAEAVTNLLAEQRLAAAARNERREQVPFSQVRCCV
ncbi:FMN reductase (NADPH) [Corticibacter populi]|uniref:FMN reductase (NADPH) n=1 Tax=Corticibacter populi TaxID=1550736 RepID=A0A3M6QGK4_9BURK|nr:NADPH-dependent FMN reductase [Corticibacter populi]RMX02226.1 FMN reductase (NADPH) [Corticibacter populi]RZS29505.1 FMN reductase [Corticibacter populi]